ncbi:MAG: hypothetical protein AAB660_00040 [Patescibacteria group bacterium]
MPPKKEAPKIDPVVEVGFVVIVLFFLWAIWSTILRYFFSGKSYHSVWQTISAWFFQYIYPIAIVVGVIISILSIIDGIRLYRKLVALSEEEKKIYGPTPEEEKLTGSVSIKNGRWEHAMVHLNSASSSDWRLAVIEADVMLDEMLRAQGYHGESIGDMLKGVEKGDMKTLDAAWEVHKIRNEIVHSGSGYTLTEREAKRAMTLYESVFREFEVI